MVTTAFTPLTTSLNGLTEETQAIRALNQLFSITAGRLTARQTDHLKFDPLARITEGSRLITEELLEAQKLLVNDPNQGRVISQCQRKIDSFNSLMILAILVQKEIDWD